MNQLKKTTLILLLCTATNTNNAQPVTPGKQIDSLLAILNAPPCKEGTPQGQEGCIQDTSRIQTLNAIAWKLLNQSDYEKAMQYANDALHLAMDKPERFLKPVRFALLKGQATAYNNIGIIYANQGNYDKALENFFVCLKIKKEIGEKKGIASSYNNIGNIYMEQGNYNKALENQFASLKIREEMGDKQGVASSYSNIGNIYYEQGKAHYNPSQKEGLFNKALENQFASLKIREEL